MPEHDLHSFMAQLTAEMSAEYQRIYARASEDPGTAGDEGEENWANLFRDWLPSTYRVETKGRLIGHDGQMSPQVDVVVLKPGYPRKLLEKRTWMAGGVAAVFECKTTLTAAHVTASLERCKRCKALYKPRTGTPRTELRSPLIYGLLAHSHSWKNKGSDPIGNIRRALDSDDSVISHPREEVDVLCVADLATWSSTLVTRYEANWAGTEEESLAKAFGATCGPMTAMTCSSVESHSQKATFQPVGALLDSLTRRLAWEDPSTRVIADYFQQSQLGGSGSGGMKPWPLASYSDEVASRVANGEVRNGVSWDDWGIGIL